MRFNFAHSLLWSWLFYMLCYSIETSANSVSQTNNSSHENTNNEIVFVVGNDSFPYQYMDSQGKADGLMIDIWKLWAKKNNHSITFLAKPWTETLDAIKNEEADVHSGITKLPYREAFMEFGEPIFNIGMSVFIHKDVVGVKTLADLGPYNVGIVNGSAHHARFQKQFPHLSLKVYQSRDEMYQDAVIGNIKVLTGMERIATRHPLFVQLSKAFPLYKKLEYDQLPLTFAVKKGNSQLRKKIVEGLKNITPIEMIAIERKWLGVESEKDTLVLALAQGNKPYMDVSEEGAAIGLLVDIWKLWSEKTKRDVLFLPESMSGALKSVESGKADIHIGYPESEKVTTRIPRAHHVYTVLSRFFYPKKIGEITALNQLNGKTIGMYSTAPYKLDFIEQYPHIKVRYFTSSDAMISAAVTGEISGYIAATQAAIVKLRDLSLLDQFNYLDSEEFEANIYALVNPEKQALISQIKEGFRLIDNRELVEIEQRWLRENTGQYFTNNRKRIDLTIAETNWIKEKKSITVGVVEDWPPIEFVDNGIVKGVTADIFAIIEKQTGLKVNYKIFANWESVLQALTDKSIDMVGSIANTPERESFANFSIDYWPTPWSIITLMESAKTNGVGDFSGKKLAFIKDYQVVDKVREKYPNVSITVVEDLEAGIKELKKGNVDGVVDTLISTARYIQDTRTPDLKLHLVEDLPSESGHIGIRNDWPLALTIINKALSTITKDTKKTIFNKWFEIKIEQGLSQKEVKEIAYKVAAVVVVFVVVVLLWTRSLQREIKRRRIAEEKMKHMATHDSLTGLPNRNLLKDRLSTSLKQHARREETLAVLFVDLDGFKQVNDSQGHDAGDELLIQIAKRLARCVRKSDTIARFGGDEFILLLNNLNHVNEAQLVADKILNSIAKRFNLSNASVKVGASIGIAVYPINGLTSSDLIKKADDAMYQVKVQGKNNFAFAD
ncbi:transporter substrate-binding domain-containing diguanylate cyclase [Flocculibacter collagenilyticus]|uniref:transporter substrate-binding domain-containing diguanylate cyclase n=1 Tax=Flocculibacter collagenilyticus TaxID=2744479 RepID=UPI0018F4232E|nr:transporter substrate-binding domain-containing protein [Flocculibacter collagenilyticus]